MKAWLTYQTQFPFHSERNNGQIIAKIKTSVLNNQSLPREFKISRTLIHAEKKIFSPGRIVEILSRDVYVCGREV